MCVREAARQEQSNNPHLDLERRNEGKLGDTWNTSVSDSFRVRTVTLRDTFFMR